MTFKDLSDEAKAWAAIGGKSTREEMDVRSMPLIEFLELISMADLKFRYEKGNPRTRGIEVRHEVLELWIRRLKRGEGK